MTPNTPYEYTNRDLLDDPETYEYSKVYGREFLEAYRDDRVATRRAMKGCLSEASPTGVGDRWQGTIDALPDLKGEASKYLPALEDVSGYSTGGVLLAETDSTVETVSLLGTLLGYPEENPPHGEDTKKWLDRLTKRFEVDKMLYAVYDEQMDPTNKDPAPLVAYPMLALVALVSHERTGNLKHLNVALKLCDMLSSKRGTLEEPGTAALTLYAIDAECTAVETLESEKVGSS